MKKIFYTFIITLLFLSTANARDLPEILKDGKIICGTYNYNINYELDTETSPIFCKIISFAIFGKEGYAEINSLGGSLRYEALKEGAIDITFDSKASIYRDDFDFTEIFMYDRQLFITLSSSKIYSLDDTDDKTRVCIADNSNSHTYIENFMNDFPKYKFKVISRNSLQGMRSAFIRGDCELLFTKETVASGLLRGQDEIESIRILKDIDDRDIKIYAIIQKDAPVLSLFTKTLIRSGLRMEEKEVSSHNVDDIIKTTKDPEIKFILGVTKGFGEPFGLSDDWFYNVIKKYGNYAEFYENIFGKDSYYNLKRGKNNLEKNGGSFKTGPILPETLRND